MTFEELPNAVSQLQEKLDNIERLLLSKSPDQESPEQWFDLNALCAYLPDKPAKPTVYGWVHQNLIPVYKSQKKLRFLKSEIDAWLLQGGSKTFPQTQMEALKFVKKGGRNAK